MKDFRQKKWRKERKRCKRLGLPWRDRLDLENWNLTWRFKIATHEGADYQRASVAHTFVDGAYLRATIEVFLVETRGLSDLELEEVLVHELLHVIVNGMRCQKGHGAGPARKGEEQVCTWLSRVLVRMWHRDPVIAEALTTADPRTIHLPRWGGVLPDILGDFTTAIGKTGTEVTLADMEAGMERLYGPGERARRMQRYASEAHEEYLAREVLLDPFEALL